MDTNTITIFIIVAFSLSLILIMKKKTIPQQLRRGLAIIALVLIVFAFFLIVYSAFNLGK